MAEPLYVIAKNWTKQSAHSIYQLNPDRSPAYITPNGERPLEMTEFNGTALKHTRLEIKHF